MPSKEVKEACIRLAQEYRSNAFFSTIREALAKTEDASVPAVFEHMQSDRIKSYSMYSSLEEFAGAVSSAIGTYRSLAGSSGRAVARKAEEAFAELYKRSVLSDASPASSSLASPGTDRPKKRARTSSGKRSGASQVSDECLELVKLLDTIMALPSSEPFNLPVSIEEYPSYYQAIENPMDYTSLRERIEGGEYTNAANAMEDMQLIWDNCLLANEDGSAICKMALKNRKEVVNMVKKAGSRFPSLAGNNTTAATDATAHKASMALVVSELKQLPFAGNFLDPVPVDVFPDYVDVVGTPMDISKVEKLLKKKDGYKTVEAFVGDLDLIWQNCQKYNLPDSAIVVESTALHAAVDVLLKKHLDLPRTMTKFPSGFSMPGTVSKRSKTGEADSGGPKKKGRSSAANAAALQARGAFKLAVAASAERGDDGPPVGPFYHDSEDLSPDEDAGAYPEDDEDENDEDEDECDETHKFTGNREATRLKNMIKPSAEEVQQGLQDDEILEQVLKSDSAKALMLTKRGGVRKALVKVLRVEHKKPYKPFQKPPNTQGEYKGMEVPNKSCLDQLQLEIDNGSYDEKPEEFGSDLRDLFTAHATFWQNNTGARQDSRDQRTMEARAVYDVLKRKYLAFFVEAVQKEQSSGKKGAASSATDAAGNVVKKKRGRPPKEKALRPDDTQAYLMGQTRAKVGRKPKLDKSKAPPKPPPYPDNEAEKEALLRRLKSKGALNVGFIRSRCIDNAFKVQLSGVDFPLTTNIYQLWQQGTFVQGYPCNLTYMHNVDYLFPFEYECDTRLELHVLDGTFVETPEFRSAPQGEWGGGPVVSSDNKHCQVVFRSKIMHVPRLGPDGIAMPTPVFRVYCGNVLLAEDPNPKRAWSVITSQPQLVMDFVGRELRVCRAILNRLCVDPVVQPFVEKVDEKKRFYVDHLDHMWLREVWRRLTTGMYELAADFVFDVRLCLEAPMRPGFEDKNTWERSRKHACALFHLLLARWLIGVQPPTSLHDLPRGDWDDWSYLELLDGRGTYPPDPSRTVTCSHCGDVCQSACGRCERAGLHLEGGGVEQLRIGKQVDFCRGELRHTRGEVSPRNCTGWHDCQSFFISDEERGHSALICSRFLLELGATRAKFAKTVDKEDTLLQEALVRQRQEEYVRPTRAEHREPSADTIFVRDDLVESLPSRFVPKFNIECYTTMGHISRDPETQSLGWDMQNAFTSRRAPGRVGRGSLSSWDLTASARKCLMWGGRFRRDSAEEPLSGSDVESDDAMELASDEDGATDTPKSAKSIVQPFVTRLFRDSDMPGSGFSGLDDAEIRNVIQGVPGASECKHYIYDEAVHYQASALARLQSGSGKGKEVELANELIQCRIAEERFFYERHDAQVRGGRILGRLERPASACEDEMENEMKVGVDPDNNSVSPRDDFSPLVTDAMPAAIRALDIEELLAVWESLHQLEPASTVMLGFEDFVCSLAPPPREVPNVGQVVFDEVCVSFTAHFLLNILNNHMRENVADFDPKPVEYHIQEQMPLNVLTWNYCARRILRTTAELVAADLANSVRETSAEYCVPATRAVPRRKCLEDAMSGNYAATLLLDVEFDDHVADTMTLLVTHPVAHRLWGLKDDILRTLGARISTVIDTLEGEEQEEEVAYLESRCVEVANSGLDLSGLMNLYRNKQLPDLIHLSQAVDGMVCFARWCGQVGIGVSANIADAATQVEVWLEGYLPRLAHRRPDLQKEVAAAQEARGRLRPSAAEAKRLTLRSEATSHPSTWATRTVRVEPGASGTVPINLWGEGDDRKVRSIDATDNAWNAGVTNPAAFGLRLEVPAYSELKGSKIHLRLERVLEVLRTKEPEQMQVKDRVDMVLTPTLNRTLTLTFIETEP